ISTLDYVLSVNLASKLAEIETGPWAEYGKTGKSITQNAVARLLKPFGITPSNVDPDNRLRGYCLSQFDDVFASYIAPPSQNEDSNRSTVQKSKGLEQVEREQPFAKEAGEQLDTLKNPNNDGLLNNRTVEEP